jgi:hypothetical protein
MHEAILRDFLSGATDTAALREDLIGAVDRSEGFHRHHIVDMAEAFSVTAAHLVRLCDAVISGSLLPHDLQPIAFCMIASDHFAWDTDTAEGDLVAETLHDWSSPETSYPLIDTTVKLFRERLLTGEDVLKKRLLT